MPTPRSHMNSNTMGLSGLGRTRQVQAWVHLGQRGGDPWIRPVWTALNEAAKAGRCAQRTKDLSELGVHISTRLTLLPRVVRRVNRGACKLYSAVADRGAEHEFTRDRKGAAFDFDGDEKYELLADLDSLFFELHSVCELMVRLFEQLHTHAGKAMPASSVGRAIQSVLKSFGQDPAWFAVLDANRNFFIHEGAPYIVVDISNARHYDLLIIKENQKKFNEEGKFIRLSQIDRIYQGFADSKATVQAHLKNLFAYEH